MDPLDYCFSGLIVLLRLTPENSLSRQPIARIAFGEGDPHDSTASLVLSFQMNLCFQTFESWLGAVLPSEYLFLLYKHTAQMLYLKVSIFNNYCCFFHIYLACRFKFACVSFFPKHIFFFNFLWMYLLFPQPPTLTQILVIAVSSQSPCHSLNPVLP